MNNDDRERLVRLETGVLYLVKKVDILSLDHDDVVSLKQTQKNIRRGVWATVVGCISTGITYLIRGS